MTSFMICHFLLLSWDHSIGDVTFCWCHEAVQDDVTFCCCHGATLSNIPLCCCRCCRSCLMLALPSPQLKFCFVLIQCWTLCSVFLIKCILMPNTTDDIDENSSKVMMVLMKCITYVYCWCWWKTLPVMSIYLQATNQTVHRGPLQLWPGFQCLQGTLERLPCADQGEASSMCTWLTEGGNVKDKGATFVAKLSLHYLVIWSISVVFFHLGFQQFLLWGGGWANCLFWGVVCLGFPSR